MTPRLRVIAAVAALCPTASACKRGPDAYGQVVVHIDTDAPVAASLDQAGVLRGATFDLLRIDVYRHGVPVASDALSRELAVDAAMFRERRASMGIVPTLEADDLSVRVRLFSRDRRIGAEPQPRTTIDITTALPPVGKTGTIDIAVLLPVDALGRARGDSEPLPATVGEGGESAVGAWSADARLPCAGEANTDEACVPGGTFWLGDPSVLGSDVKTDVHDERLVAISAFFLDRREVTVGDFRAEAAALGAAGVEAPTPWNGQSGESESDACTFTSGPSAADPTDRHAALPLTCVSWRTAQAFCRAKSRDLPTEAQIEFASTGLGEERPYVWGDAEPDCTFATFGRGVVDRSCRGPGHPFGASPAGSGARDRLVLAPGVEFVDLAGNVAEWTRDVWSGPNEGYWSDSRPLRNPVADLASADGDRRTVRGSSWAASAHDMLSSHRRSATPDTKSASVGFRCAR